MNVAQTCQWSCSVFELPLRKRLCTDGMKMSASVCKTLHLISTCLYAGAPVEMQLAACQVRNVLRN